MANTICRICLRTDRKVKNAKQILTDLHEELCDYTLCTGITIKYCMECEYLLKKMYNFKQKCMMADNIFKKWKKAKSAEKQPVTHLHTLLPPSSLGIWTASNNQIYSFKEEGPSSSMDVESSSLNTFASKGILFVENQQSDCQKNCTENKLAKEDNKSESECEIHYFPDDNLDDIVSVKSEASTISVEDIHLDNTSILNNIEGIVRMDILSNDDGEIDKHHVDKGDNDDTMASPMKQHISEDHTYSSVVKKRTLSELANLTFSDDDFMDNGNDTADQAGVAKKKVVKKSDNKKRKLNETLDEQSETTKKKMVVKKSNSKKQKLNDTLHEHPEKETNTAKQHFSKQRLLALLESKFASPDELKTVDGKKLDCQYILKCINESLEFPEMKRLWRLVANKERLPLSQTALEVLESIQNKTYKNEYEMYESVFVIERYKTRKEVLEGFQKRATYESYVSAPYKCDKCYQGFQFEMKLQYHNRYHDSSRAFVCAICSSRYKTSRQLAHHVNSHKIVFKCKLCPLVTCYKPSMKNHYHQHKGKTYECEPCKLSFRSKSSYCSHLTHCKFRRSGKTHACEECERRFSSTSGLRNHKDQAHQLAPTDSNYKCKHSKRRFTSLSTLCKHSSESHTKVPRKRGPALKNRFKCRVCDATGDSHGWLTFHIRTEHPAVNIDVLYADKKKHLCDTCGKGFATSFTLRDHINVHNGVRRYACPKCPKRFYRSASLGSHMTLHAPPAQRCDVCGKVFRSQSNLYNHMRSHIGNRCFKCTLCGKGFVHRGSLKEHVMGVHNQVRRKKGASKTATRRVKKSVEAD